MKKSVILTNLEESREAFLDVLDSIPLSEFQTPAIENDWSIKEILAHLCHWEAELIKLLWRINQGNLPKGLTIDDQFMSARQSQIWIAESTSRDLDRILEDFHAIRNHTIARIEDLSDQDLNLRLSGRQSKAKSLYDWIVVLSIDHEREHLEAIRTWLRNHQASTDDKLSET
jgi:hypothetical protein